MFNDKFIILGN